MVNDGIVGFYNDYFRVKAPAVTVTGRGEIGHAVARDLDFTPVVRLLSLKSNHYNHFLARAINNLNVVSESTGVPQLTVPQLEKYEIKFPKTLEEEKQIGNIFVQIDNLITLHQRKFNDILVYKLSTKFLFLKLAKNVWEQRELFDVADYRNGKAHENDIDDDGKYIVINSKFVSTEGKIKKYSNKQNEPLFQNEIAFVLSDVPNGRAIAKTFLVDKSSKYTLNQRIAGITPHSNINPKFLSITMNRNKYFLQFDDGVKQTNLSLNDMKKFEEFYPKKQEQDKIGELFTNLDNLITLHHRKYTYIFYSWEQRKLSDYATFRRGSFPQPYGKAEWYDGLGSMPFVQVADVGNDMKLVNETKQRISKVAQPMSVFIPKQSVIVTLQGTIGRVAITQYDAYLDRTVLYFDSYKNSINKNFWSYVIKNKFLEEAKSAPGGTIKTITKEVLSNFDLKMPLEVNEQNKIGELFTNLDNLITLHQHKELKRRNDNNEHLRW